MGTSLMNFIYNTRFDTYWNVIENTEISYRRSLPSQTISNLVCLSSNKLNIRVHKICSNTTIDDCAEIRYTQLFAIYDVYYRFGIHFKIHIVQLKILNPSHRT